MADPFSPEQLERYSRQMLLKEVGGRGQTRLRTARIAMGVGAGLGSRCVEILLRAGVGWIGVAPSGETPWTDDLAELNPETRLEVLDSFPPPLQLMLSLGETPDLQQRRVEFSRRHGVVLLMGGVRDEGLGWLAGYDPHGTQGCPLCPVEEGRGIPSAPALVKLMAGWLEMVAAGEVMKSLLGFTRGIMGEYWVLDAGVGTCQRQILARDTGCVGCGGKP